MEKKSMGARGRTVLLVLWIAVIFGHSLQNGEISMEESGWLMALLENRLHWRVTEFLIRKCAHFAEFAVLGTLIAIQDGQFWERLGSRLCRAVCAGAAVALCDETIQLFVPGRCGKVQDVWLDIAGVVTGAVLTVALRRRRSR